MTKEEIRTTHGDRRKHERLSKIFKMHFQTVENLGEKSPYQEGTVLDISDGGLRFLAPRLFGVGTELLIVLEFPGWLERDENETESEDENEDVGAVQAIGKVVHVGASSTHPGRFEVGVQFSVKMQAQEGGA